MDRPYRYIDIQKINASELQPVDDSPENVLFESLLDVLQLAEHEGMAEQEVDDVLRRIVDYRAARVRGRLRITRGRGSE